jgi:hypothetical protein
MRDSIITTPGEEDLLGNVTPRNPLVPVLVSPRGQRLNKVGSSESSRLTPLDRTIAFLRGSSFQIGLLTNGEQWAVVHCPASGSAQSGVTSIATWYAEMWLEEPVTFRALRALFGARRWFNAEPANTLPKLLERSALNQGAVTAQLGRQVRQAVALLISALDRADQDKGRGLLSGIPETTLYEAAISVMMRMVFLFFAEERELLPSTDPLYASAYAVSTIREQLQADADSFGPEVLERRHDAWSRLLATFRAVYSGLGHDRITLPAYGGQLFDPDRFSFLEGRAAGTSWKDTQATPLPVDNRTILYALEALQILRERGSEPRHLTFRELDVPDIGHIYESLLDHTAKRASSVILGLVGREGEEPDVGLKELRAWQKDNSEKLVSELADCTGKTPNSLRNLLDEDVDERLRDRLRISCQTDESLLTEVLPFANLVRSDPWGNPVLVLPGSVFVTEGADRRTTGTHYTPASLTDPIVQYTLEPIVYHGPAEGLPRDEWKLKSAKQLLELKVCDMACGSGAFLVAAARYLAARLEEAWAALGVFEPGSPRRSPDGFESSGHTGEDLIPLELEERAVYALRVVAQRCIYGVDKNPIAAEMAKLSLWLLTLAKGKPFTFVDHAIKSGDSLIGLTREELEAFNLDDTRTPVFGFGPTLDFLCNTRETLALVRAETVADVERQARLLSEADKKTEALRWIADVLIAMELNGVKGGERIPIGTELGILLQSDDFDTVREIAGRYNPGLRAFHWNLEFPEVFSERQGFDAIVGNPPFVHGQKVARLFGHSYREYLVRRLALGKRGSADYSAYFFLKVVKLLGAHGSFGLLSTNTIAQGDTREVALDQLTDVTIFRAISTEAWPGDAAVCFSAVWAIASRHWHGDFILDGRFVVGITTSLTERTLNVEKPFKLKSNSGKAIKGSEVGGMETFVIDRAEAKQLLDTDPASKDVVLPFLGYEDLVVRPDMSTDRWAIFFRDWSHEKAKSFVAWHHGGARLKSDPQAIGCVPFGFAGRLQPPLAVSGTKQR